MAINKCRACLLEKSLLDLFDWYLPVDDIDEMLSYLDCFQICTQLDVKKADSISTYIKDIHFLCHDCIKEMICSYRFLRKAQRSAQELYALSEKSEFEYINIQEWCKSDIFTDIAPKLEQDTSENNINAEDEFATSVNKLDIEKFNQLENNNGLLESTTSPHRDIPPEKQNCISANSQETHFFKTDVELKKQPSEREKVVKLEMVEDAHDDTFEVMFKNNNENAIHIGDSKNDVLEKGISKQKIKTNIKQERKTKLRRLQAKSVVTEFKEIPCEYCKKLFPENKLKQHKSRYHRPKIFLCDICPSSFSIANNLRRHQRTHDLHRERIFSCKDCGRTFFTEDVYRTHIKIHQSSRQAKFKCTECDKVFLHKGSLTLHIQKHIGPTNECGICMKRYVRKIDLEVHMRNHSGDLPYGCSKCEKAFMTTSALRKHELLHNGIRYKCDICNKHYSHPSKLSRHRLEHTGLPLKCAMCEKGFAEQNKIRRHIKSVHKVEDSLQMNKLIIKMPKNDECTTKEK